MKHPPSDPMTAPEPDLQEHQRLIDRALTQTAVRHIAREAARPGPVPLVMVVMVTFVSLLMMAAVLVLLVVDLQ